MDKLQYRVPVIIEVFVEVLDRGTCQTIDAIRAAESYMRAKLHGVPNIGDIDGQTPILEERITDDD